LNIDLHIHTNASDGSLSPAQILKEASQAGLRAISISDHDTTDGLSEAFKVQGQYDLEIVPGVEVSATDPKGEVHILGYYMNYEDPVFQSFLEKPRHSRPARIAEMCAKLSDLGIDVTFEEVFEVAGGKETVGRPHLARVLQKKGYVKEMEEAFQRYLTNGAPAYVKRFKNTSAQTLEMIHQCGGISVIAHPGLIPDPNLVPSLVEQGAMGIEVYCHDHNRQDVERFSRIAEHHGLLVTGGSDYHGDMLEKDFKLGDLQVPYECFLKLKEAKESLPYGDSLETARK